jgi:hypothetical protein
MRRREPSQQAVPLLLAWRQVDQRTSTSCRLHHVAVLPHEFGHSFTAWITDIKSDPWDIEWGDGSVGERKIASAGRLAIPRTTMARWRLNLSVPANYL